MSFSMQIARPYIAGLAICLLKHDSIGQVQASWLLSTFAHALHATEQGGMRAQSPEMVHHISVLDGEAVPLLDGYQMLEGGI